MGFTWPKQQQQHKKNTCTQIHTEFIEKKTDDHSLLMELDA